MSTSDSASTDKYKVPLGLRPMLEAFARETLRAQPEDLCKFGQLFFDILQLHKKQNPGSDVIADQLCYEMFRNDLQRRCKSLHREEEHDGARPHSPQDLAATKIQAVFRGHRVRANPDKFGVQSPEMARRQSTDRLSSKLDHKKDVKRHSVGGYTHMVHNTPEDRAATKIQSEIRGFLTRRHVNQVKQKNTEAATTIQAHIRGFLTRKRLDEKGMLSANSRSRSRSSIQSNNADEMGN